MCNINLFVFIICLHSDDVACVSSFHCTGNWNYSARCQSVLLWDLSLPSEWIGRNFFLPLLTIRKLIRFHWQDDDREVRKSNDLETSNEFSRNQKKSKVRIDPLLPMRINWYWIKFSLSRLSTSIAQKVCFYLSVWLEIWTESTSRSKMLFNSVWCCTNNRQTLNRPQRFTSLRIFLSFRNFKIAVEIFRNVFSCD